MKILAPIPVEKVTGPGWYSFRNEVRELEVIRVMRTPATRYKDLNRWHYMADVADHPDMHPEAVRIGANGRHRVNIQRRGLNPKWKPPIFADGSYFFEVPTN